VYPRPLLIFVAEELREYDIDDDAKGVDVLLYQGIEIR